jgi:hypothetical protein
MLERKTPPVYKWTAYNKMHGTVFPVSDKALFI